MNKRRKLKIKAYCKLTVFAILNDKNEIQEIDDIEEIDEILGNEEVIDIIY